MGDSTEASESRDIALRWHSMLHLALFRTESSARSGARVRWFLAEREKAPARAGRKPAGSDASVDEALKLVAAGELSRAASRLTSSGLADACDPRILGQLRDKHLPRHGALPEVAHLDDAVDLNQKLGMLPRRSGTGSDMLPNEHLTLVHARLPGQRQATATMELVKKLVKSTGRSTSSTPPYAS
ncbi:hypothetical protein JL722_2708 [Aureococcus anophagefferens]|nr:hypothetical protein JL722_2708 [Aureococcus anophagefferens]KAH8077345.1 hypothetical protein JL720_10069 [Aureococcus anophagefferens]